MTKQEVEILLDSIETVIQMLPYVPEKNCKCHLGFPPCDDCVEYSGLRQAIEEYKTVRNKFTDKFMDETHRNRLDNVE